MVTRNYTLDLEVLIKPVWFGRVPTGRIGLGNDLTDFAITEPTWFKFQVNSSEETTVKLTVEHYGKTDQDSDMSNGNDTAIIIEQIKLNELTSPKFAWAGVYRPNYPESYVEFCQTQNKILDPILPSYTYLGWNGLWELKLTLPIYTWIHKVEDLGWIYD